MHASDVAKAIKLILTQDKKDTYVICGNENIKVMDLVLKVYSLNDIPINVIDSVLYSNNKIVAIIENMNKGIDNVPINITGNSLKLNALGWSPKFSLDDILNEIVCHNKIN